MAWVRETAEDGSPILADGRDSIAVDPDGDVVVTLDHGGRPVWAYLPFELLEAFVTEERARRQRTGPPKAQPKVPERDDEL